VKKINKKIRAINVVQAHSRSPMWVPIKSPYATSY